MREIMVCKLTAQ